MITNRYTEYVKDKTLTVVSNAGMWLMFAFDFAFFLTMLFTGFAIWFLVAMSIVMALELLLLLSLLPHPVLQLKFLKGSWPFYFVFLAMPVLMFAWGIELRHTALAFFSLLALLRLFTYGFAFIVSRNKKAVLTSGVMALVMAVLSVLGLTVSSGTFQYELFSRPVAYEFDYSLGGYKVKKIYSGLSDNVHILDEYNGESVVALGNGSVCNLGTKSLTLPKYLRLVESGAIEDSSLTELTVESEDITMLNASVTAPNLKEITFTADDVLPELTYEAFYETGSLYDNELPVLRFSQKCFDRNMKSGKFDTWLNHKKSEPILNDNENFVLFDTKYTESGGKNEDGSNFVYRNYIPSIVADFSTAPALPQLNIPGYEFIGWLDGAYGKKITSLEKGKNYRLNAKYLYLTTLNLDPGSGVLNENYPTKFHRETPDILLPDADKDGYTFVGWFLEGEETAVTKGDRFTQITSGTTGDRFLFAHYQKNYTISYHADNADNMAAVDALPAYYYAWADDVTLPKLTKSGYTFMGWFSDAAKTAPITKIESEETRNYELYAKFNLNYSVTYHLNGGAHTQTPTTSYHVESPAFDLGIPQRTGYRFDGWFDNAGFGGSAVSSVQQGTTGNKDFYAKWTPITYTVEYEGGVGTTGGTPDSTFTYDQTNTFAANGFSKTGYTFAGWKIGGTIYTEPATAVNFTATQDEAVTAKAVWAPITYTVNYEGGGGAGTTPDSTFTYDAANTFANNMFSKTGYLFDGWKIGDTVYKDLTTRVNFASTQDAAVTATAQWTPITYTVEYEGGIGSTGSVSSSTFTYDATNTISENGFNKTGYTFRCWLIGGNTYNPGNTNENFAENQGTTITATAQWTPITYTIEYEGGIGSTGSVSSSTFTYDATNTISENGFNKTGYTFAGWKIDDTTYTEPTCDVNFASTQDAVVSATAQWTANTYTMEYIGGSGAGGNTANSTFTYDANNTIKENGFAKTGYTFAGWRINGTVYQPGKTAANFAATQDAIIKASAEWQAITYTVEYAGGVGADGATASSTFTYDGTNTFAVCNFTKTGYTFAGWKIDDTTYTEPTCDVNFASTQDAVVSATAQWTANTYLIRYEGGLGAEGSMIESSFTYGESNMLKENAFTKTGYTFAGWEINGTVYQPGETDVNFTEENNLTVTATAVWTPIE